jgi:hypothetical protein
MTPPKKQPGKKTVRIVYTSREKSDPKALLKLVNEALKPEGIRVTAKEEKPEPEPEQSEEKRAAQEHLEAAALSAAAKLLDEKADKIQQTQAKAQSGKNRSPSKYTTQGRKKGTPGKFQTQIQAKSKLRQWLEKAETVGYQIVSAFLRGAKQAILDWWKS